jgi:hypothetical protein
MKNTKNAVKTKTVTKASAVTKAPRQPNVSFNEYLALRNPTAAAKGELNRLVRKELVAVTESAETVLARETKSAIFYKKVIKRNASLTPKGQALLDALSAKLA